MSSWFKNWFSRSSSNPTLERHSTRKRFNKLVDNEVASRLKRIKHGSTRRYDWESDSENRDSRLSDALRPIGRYSSRHSSRRRSRDDDRIRRLKDELSRLDRRYSSASESEGSTAELQRAVSKLERRFNQARQELASVLATKAARHAARGSASPDQISAAVTAALSTAGLAAPGLAAIAPATPYAMQYAALQAVAQQAIQQNPNPTGSAAAQINIAVQNAEAARAKAILEGAQNAARYHDINQQNDAIVQANIDSAKEHAVNIGKGVYGIGGLIYNPLAGIVNKGKSLAARAIQY